MGTPAVAATQQRYDDNDDWTPYTVNGRSASPPRINPYHFVHHPDHSDDPLPPLPPHLQRLASGETATDDEGDSDTSQEPDSDDSDDENERFFSLDEERGRPRGFSLDLDSKANATVSANTNGFAAPRTPNAKLAPAAEIEEPGPRRIMKKVSNVFRRTPDSKDAARRFASPHRQRSPVMQGAPPSPPLSDASDGDYTPSVAVTEATTVSAVFEDRNNISHQEKVVIAASVGSTGVEPNDLATPPTSGLSAQLQPVTEAGESTHALPLQQQTPQTIQPSPQPQQIQQPPAPTFGGALVSEPEPQEDDAPTPTAAYAPSIDTMSEGSHRLPAPSIDNASEGSHRPPPSAYSRDASTERPPVAPFMMARRVSSGSTSSRAGSLSMVRSGRLAPQRDPQPGASPDWGRGMLTDDDASSLPRNSFSSPPFNAVDLPNSVSSSPLPPPAAGRPAPQRRNTNPTQPTPPMAPRVLSSSVSSTGHGPQQSLDGNINLPPDILAQADILRREQLQKRQKKMSLLVSPQQAPDITVDPADGTASSPKQAGPAQKPDRRVTVRRKETEEAKVLVGNLVGEGHRNYVLMYNMLTGIRVAVSRCQAKIKRPLTEEDYVARHKYSFDMLGNELTPSAKYDFKFKDYAPWVFRELREDYFHIDPADYLLSLTAKYILSELGSPGKSGSFFYYSRDYRFIIKTISHSEHCFMRSILKDYHEHVRNNPHTLLSRFYGLHRVKMPRGRKIHFVIMNNLFPPHRDIHETYDLKGSAYGREYPEEKAKTNPRAVLKDINWVNRGRTLEFGPEKRALLTEQLRRDMEFLKKINVMDYSLLVGIHNMERGNRDNLRETTLAVFNPQTMPVRRKPSSVKAGAEAKTLPQGGSADRRHFLFYQDEGGLQATDEQNQPMDMIYYVGIIDICTPYNLSKRIEHAWKSMTENAITISCVDPDTYGHRFLDFLMSVMRGGDTSLRPAGLESPHKLVKPVGCEHDERNEMRMSAEAHRPTLARLSGEHTRAEATNNASYLAAKYAVNQANGPGAPGAACVQAVLNDAPTRPACAQPTSAQAGQNAAWTAGQAITAPTPQQGASMQFPTPHPNLPATAQLAQTQSAEPNGPPPSSPSKSPTLYPQPAGGAQFPYPHAYSSATYSSGSHSLSEGQYHGTEAQDQAALGSLQAGEREAGVAEADEAEAAREVAQSMAAGQALANADEAGARKVKVGLRTGEWVDGREVRAMVGHLKAD
ncbi:putative 1-phosphatidylinositol-4-phosphate 5-kinase protein [Trichosporon asahii var. asahii CBS 8904]|uniref:1-phosphatidylinositol-4-phosphate 5-kinase n=1 Tax=Trichosporon asahii var. asahii (strain CBS 8904) TaxID=1220162 RepID=K1VXN6_TRIAC|nr:putative 1-phosphatidylinositol-4-phosphate 5-kinase protein [Trichosporon asahii var. asahii CBS 8904]